MVMRGVSVLGFYCISLITKVFITTATFCIIGNINTVNHHFSFLISFGSLLLINYMKYTTHEAKVKENKKKVVFSQVF